VHHQSMRKCTMFQVGVPWEKEKRGRERLRPASKHKKKRAPKDALSIRPPDRLAGSLTSHVDLAEDRIIGRKLALTGRSLVQLEHVGNDVRVLLGSKAAG
jgi:hypothetical protein